MKRREPNLCIPCARITSALAVTAGNRDRSRVPGCVRALPRTEDALFQECLEHVITGPLVARVLSIRLLSASLSRRPPRTASSSFFDYTYAYDSPGSLLAERFYIHPLFHSLFSASFR